MRSIKASSARPLEEISPLIQPKVNHLDLPQLAYKVYDLEMGVQKPVFTRKSAAAARGKKKAPAAAPVAPAYADPLIVMGQPDIVADTTNDSAAGARIRPSRGGKSQKYRDALTELTRRDGDAEIDGDPDGSAETEAEGEAGDTQGGAEGLTMDEVDAEIERFRKMARGVRKGEIPSLLAMKSKVNLLKPKPVFDEPRPEPKAPALSYLDIPADIMNFYDDLSAVNTIPMQLPMIVRPEQHAQGYIIEATQPWTSEKLFRLYLYAYSRNNYHLCDLITDTWIRAFQARDVNPRTKFWKQNRSEFKKESKNAYYNDNDDSILWLDPGVDSFNFKLLKELYDHTNSGCGARKVWADALALCGNWLEQRMEWKGNGMELWHPQLMWDVLHTALRLVRVRLTLKIEEGNPAEWCIRYHEHSKHGAKCYRELAKGDGSMPAETDVEMSG